MFKLLEIQNGSARYAREDGSVINCMARFSHMPDEWLPFTAMNADTLSHARAVWASLQAGEAGEIAPYVAPPPVVPRSVSPLQIRRALRQAGLKAQADAYAADLDDEAREAWEYATVIMRNDPFIEGARVALGLSESEVDDLFILAATL